MASNMSERLRVAIAAKITYNVPYPFSTADETTDIVFVVEGKRIHFAKAILSMCSPVFRTMFAADFAEREAKEIPLPWKKYVEMVEFFKHLHPAFGPMTEVTDDSLFALLHLAEEYQINSVKEKCQQFIGHQLHEVELVMSASEYSPLGCDRIRRFSVDRNLLYLLACDRFHLYRHKNKLVALAAERNPLSELTRASMYKQFETNSMINVLRKKCEMLEAELAKREPKFRW